MLFILLLLISYMLGGITMILIEAGGRDND